MLLETEIQKLENLLHSEHFEQVNTSISARGVDWHVEHSLKAINLMIEGLIQSNPELYSPSFNLGWRVVKFLNKIPRGKAKAPKYSDNTNEVIMANVEAELEKTKKLVLQVDNLPENAFIKHFAFGHLNVKATKKLMYIHTNHHIKIIEDILK
ncbi:DUF1569 domain-containing protein [Flammeovirga sp. SubArs3]|uniref:DUF1569 domain-containing protein n=1 Tax=Flammeovirga sp. SubArs3 TaxID=2995316 RepID=UPI00248C82AE|nr:DUF1569 domain-containing protein [Flammeovirga sp. SubArs3]